MKEIKSLKNHKEAINFYAGQSLSNEKACGAKREKDKPKKNMQFLVSQPLTILKIENIYLV